MTHNPKYTVKKTSEFGLYAVYDRKGRVIPGTEYADRSEAEDHAQRLVEDDAWTAANR